MNDPATNRDFETATADPASVGPRGSMNESYRGVQRVSNVLAERSPVPEVSELILAAGQHTLLSGVLGVSAAVILAFLACSLVPARYEARSFVQVRPRVDQGFSNSQSRAEDTAFARVQKTRVIEQPVLMAALERPEAAAMATAIPEYRAVDWLRDRVQVQLESGSEVMTISVNDTSPRVALALNSAVTSAYLEDHLKRTAENLERQREELQSAADNADRVLGEQWQQLHAAAEQVGSGDPQQLTVRDEIQLQGYREYAQRLRAAQLRGNQLRSQLAEEQLRLEQQPSDPSDAALEALMINHPQMLLGRERLQSIDKQLRELSAIASSDDSPRIRRLRDDRDHSIEEFNRLAEELRPKLRDQLLQVRTDGRGERLTQIRDEIDRNGDEVVFLRDMLAQLETQIQRTGSNSGVRLEMIRHNIDRQAKLADSLWQSLERLKIDSMSGPRVSLIETAKLPQTPSRSKQWKAAASAGLVGLMLTVLSIGYMEWRGCRVRHPRDVLLRTHLSLFGTGSFAPGMPWLWRLRHARRDPLDSGVNEVVAHLMLRSSNRDRLPSVLVSSATDGEPRHIVAIELARSLAAAGYHTLLIDADFASSRLSRSLGVDDRTGLAQCGERDTRLDSAWLATSDPRLWLLPSGAVSVGPPRGLSAARAVASILGPELAIFQAVVVCGPAVLTNSESVILASRVDETLLAMVLGRSRWNLLATAHHRMNFAGISVLGAVLHIASPRAKQDQLQIAAVATVSTEHPFSDLPDETEQCPEESLQKSLQDLREDVQRVADQADSKGTSTAASSHSVLREHSERGKQH